MAGFVQGQAMPRTTKTIAKAHLQHPGAIVCYDEVEWVAIRLERVGERRRVSP